MIFGSAGIRKLNGERRILLHCLLPVNYTLGRIFRRNAAWLWVGILDANITLAITGHRQRKADAHLFALYKSFFFDVQLCTATHPGRNFALLFYKICSYFARAYSSFVPRLSGTRCKNAVGFTKRREKTAKKVLLPLDINPVYAPLFDQRVKFGFGKICNFALYLCNCRGARVRVILREPNQYLTLNR